MRLMTGSIRSLSVTGSMSSGKLSSAALKLRSGFQYATLVRTLFFEGVLGALEQFRSNRAASLVDEAWRLCQGAMTKVLAKVAHWNPDLDFKAALESLPEDADIAALKERIWPIIRRIDGIQRVEGQRRD